MRDESITIYVLVYIDDMLLVGPDKNELTKIAASLAKNVELRVEKDVTKFLGIIIYRNRSKGSLKKPSPFMIDDMINKFRMDLAGPSDTAVVPDNLKDFPVSME